MRSGSSDVPPEVAEVLELCRRARDASDGWFDPWAMPGGVDPTGLVKGWAAERALDELRRAERAGRDDQRRRRHRGVRTAGAWAAVADRHPAPAGCGRILLTAELDGAGAVATSGSYERGQHLLDPRSGQPTSALLSATVIGHDLAFADALATALYASEGALLERLSALAGYHGFIVDGRGDVRASRGFPIVLHGVEAVPA